MNEVDRQLRLIKSRAEEIIPESELKAKLERSLSSSKPLKVKFGIDPTGSELHLGHAVPLRKLKQFQELGHSIQFLIGSFTAKIGDPTGKNETRKMLTDEEISKNCERYLEQASSVIDITKIDIHYNGDWLSKLTFEDLIKIMSHFSLSLMISREDFAKRLAENNPISLVELSYPLMQAYDSVHLQSDIEIGGTEQKFNLLRGRDLQRSFGQEPQVCITLPILEGTNGRDKMSKSLNNYISIMESPKEMFGKVMSIKDELLASYYKWTTDLSEEELHEKVSGLYSGTIKPYDAKKELAERVVTLYHGEAQAQQSRDYFEQLFSKREIPSELEERSIDGRDLITFISEEAGVSKSQARRLLESRSVKLDNEILSENSILRTGVIKIGKKTIYRIK